MSEALRFECDFRFQASGRGARKQLAVGPAPAIPKVEGRVPRVAKLTALAIRLEGLVRSGAVADYAELARLGHVTRARVTQILNLILFAPDIQEELLFLPRIVQGRDTLHLRQLQPIALTTDWRKQRRLWRELVGAATTPTRTTNSNLALAATNIARPK